MAVHRRSRLRAAGVAALLVALAAGWVVTARVGTRRGARTGPASEGGVGVSSRVAAGDVAARRRLRAVVPAGVGCVAGSDSALRCSSDGFLVEYRAVHAGSLSTAYLDAIGPGATRSQGPPGCARGHADERAWSRPDRPHRVAGRFACDRAGGRATIWWTVTDRGVLGRAVAANGDLAGLYAWWLAHSER